MKMKLLILSLFSCMTVMAAKTLTLTIKWTFEEVVEGYDHENKMLVTIDGKSMGESKVFKETDHATFVIEVTKGKHDIKIQNYSFYEGKWDIHTKENQYSVDARYENTLNLSQNTVIDMVFNVDKETESITVKGGKVAGDAGVPLTITWKFTHVEEGFDHQNRMQVRVDGKLIGTSDTFYESKLSSMKVNVPAGSHTITVENYAFYEGNWELHSIENNYSVDAFYEANMLFKKKKRSINLIFDIETLETTVVVK